ncbi:MAG: spore coat protein CotH [Polaribacter sp.]|jgi:spore coat protein CotH
MKKLIPLLLSFIFIANAISAQDMYDVLRVQEVKVRFVEKKWDDVLDSLKQVGNDDRLLGQVTIDGVLYDSIGVRYKGNSSYFNVRNQGSSKLPFNIKVNYKKKKQSFPGGYTSLKLSNVFRDPSFLREVMSYEIARKYMPAPKACYVKLYVNDVLIGLYNSTESIDENFLTENYGYDEGTLLKCDPSWKAKLKEGCNKGDKASLMFQGEDTDCYKGNYELKSDKGWKDLIELTETLNEKTKEVEKILNIDQVLWMHAFNSVLVNLDSYSGRLCHNYYLFRDSFDVFHPLVWDMNLSFGGFRHDGTGTALTNEKMIRLSPFIHYKSPNRPLISKLLSNSLNRKVYLAHIRTIIKDNFRGSGFQSRANQLQQVIDYHVQKDTNKLYTYEAFKGNVDSSQQAGKEKIIGIMELMTPRIQYLEAHPLLSKTPPSLSAVQHRVEGEETKVSAQADNVEDLWLMYRQKAKAPFKRIRMTDNGKAGDTTADDKTYTVLLKLEKGAEYYLIAENEKTAALMPERAAFEFYTVK